MDGPTRAFAEKMHTMSRDELGIVIDVLNDELKKRTNPGAVLATV